MPTMSIRSPRSGLYQSADAGRSPGLFIPILLLGTLGCSREATVTGKVSYQGKSVAYGSVIFLNQDKTARSGAIEPDGSYTVKGVKPGEVKIGVISRDPAKGRKHSEQHSKTEKATPENWFPLPSKLEDPATSELSCTIDSGNVIYDIELK